MSEQSPTAREGENNHEQEPEENPRIYVASLSDYNAGRLHGSWLDAAQPAEALLAGISEMLAGSPEPIAEEWAIHDFEGFGEVRLSEYENIETISKIGLGIDQHGPAFGAWASSLDDWGRLDAFEDCYLGHWDSVPLYAEDLLEAFGLPQIIEREVPESLQPYVRIDSESFGRDLWMGGDIQVVEDRASGGYFLFESA